MVITVHKFIKDTKVRPSDKYMILGTIHPHNTQKFKINYFYGNKASLWSILRVAFPNLKFESKENIKNILKHHAVFITDCIKKCGRKNKGAADKDLTNIVYNELQIRNAFENSQINTIFFTSGEGTNNALRLFRKMFNIKPKEINLDKEAKTLVIPKKYFGRSIKGIVLISPSGQANRSIPRSTAYKEKKLKYGSDYSVSKFKIDFYRNKFKKVFG